MVCILKQTIFLTTQLVVWSSMDVAIFFDGRFRILDMEAVPEKAESETGSHNLFNSAGIKFFVVIFVLLVALTNSRIYRYCCTLDYDHLNYSKVQTSVKMGGIPLNSLPAVGHFCHTTEFLNCSAELMLKIEIKKFTSSWPSFL